MGHTQRISSQFQAKTILAELSSKLDYLPDELRASLQADLLRLQDCLNAQAGMPSTTVAAAQAFTPTAGLPHAAGIPGIQLEAVLNGIMAGVIVYDQNLVIQMTNAQVVEMSGFDPVGEDLPHFIQRFHPENEYGELIPVDQLPVSLAAQGKTVLNREMSITNQDGHQYHLMVSAKPLHIDQEFAGIVVVWNDVTKQHALSKENYRQKELLERIIVTVQVGILVLDGPEFRISLANPVIYRMLGGQCDFKGCTAAEVWPEGADSFIPLLEHISLSGEPYHAENVRMLVHRDQQEQEVYLTLDCTPLYSSQGQVKSILVVISETTPEVRIRQQLEAERDRMKVLLESIADEVWFCDSLGNITLMNRWALNNLGFEKPEDLNLPVEDLVRNKLNIFNLDGLPREENDIPLVRSLQGEVVRGQNMIRNSKTGEIRYRDYSSAPVRSKENEILGAVAVVRDITEQKRLETQLKLSEDRYRQILKTTYDGIWTWDAEGKVDFINQRGADILGYTLEEILGFSPVDFYYAEDKDTVLQEFKNRALGISEHGEICIRHKSGKEVWIIASTVPIWDDNGCYTGNISMFTDITQSKAAAKALRESEERFRVALAAVPISVFSLDRDLRYTWLYNPRYIQSVESVLGKRNDEFRHRDDVSALMEAEETVLETRQGLQKEIRIKLKGEWISFLLTLEPTLDAGGELTGMIGAALDITQQRRMEEQQLEYTSHLEVHELLLVQREMERQNLARTLHDGPLQGLIGLLFSIKLIRESPPDEEYPQRLQEIYEEARQQVRELRDLCYELRPPAVGRFGLAKAIQSHAEGFTQRNTVLKMNLDLDQTGEDLPENVCLDLFQIYQESLRNIISHSGASRVWVSFKVEPEKVILEIRDNGKGFHVPLNWVDYARQGQFGLVGMKERAEAIGGGLEIHSREGRTSITVRVPKVSVKK